MYEWPADAEMDGIPVGEGFRSHEPPPGVPVHELRKAAPRVLDSRWETLTKAATRRIDALALTPYVPKEPNRDGPTTAGVFTRNKSPAIAAKKKENARRDG